jgi:acyl-coenzyme A thioesterase PaaI-like protein
MQSHALPFRLDAEARSAQLRRFNERTEVAWFGFEGSFLEPGTTIIRFSHLNLGLQGGGGTHAINGGVIAAGFDAAFVLAGLGHYESEVVVTLELSVKFLSLALASKTLEFRAHIARSAKNFGFAQGFLADCSHPASPHLAIATAMVAPAR